MPIIHVASLPQLFVKQQTNFGGIKIFSRGNIFVKQPLIHNKQEYDNVLEEFLKDDK